jgi:hypothetical protein
MGVKQFTKSVKVVKEVAPVRATRPPVVPINPDKGGEKLPWATIEKNGKTGYIMHLGRDAVSTFKLKPGDRIFLGIDKRAGRVTFRKHAKGTHTLVMHGGIAERLKVSVTDFYRAELAPYDLGDKPIKGNITPGEMGWVSFPFRTRKRTTAAVVSAPVVEEPVKSKRIRKPAPAPVVEDKPAKKLRKEAVTS